jgi:hypothetical protein
MTSMPIRRRDAVDELLAVEREGIIDTPARTSGQGLDALALTGQPQYEGCCELLLKLGEARWNTGRLDSARQAYEQAAQLAEQLGDATSLARAALGFCGPHRVEVDGALTRP